MKKFLIIVTGIILLLAGFLFYWFEIRTINIRSTCAEKILKSDGTTIGEGETAYKWCLRKKGIKE